MSDPRPKRFYRFQCPKCGAYTKVPLGHVNPLPAGRWYRYPVDCPLPTEISYQRPSHYWSSKDPSEGGKYNAAVVAMRMRPRWKAVERSRCPWWSAPSPDPAVWLPALLADIGERCSPDTFAPGKLWRIKARHHPTVVRYGWITLANGRLRWVEQRQITNVGRRGV